MQKGSTILGERRREMRRQYVGPLFAKWKREGRTLTFLAQQMNVDLRDLSHWKNGVRGIPEVYLLRLCVEVGIDRRLIGECPYPFKQRAPRRRSA